MSSVCLSGEKVFLYTANVLLGLIYLGCTVDSVAVLYLKLGSHLKNILIVKSVPCSSNLVQYRTCTVWNNWFFQVMMDTEEENMLFVQNETKSTMTLMFAGAANGTLLRPQIIFKSVDVWDTWIRNGPRDALYSTSKTGWMNTETFHDWVKLVAIPYFAAQKNKYPGVLILDNYG